MPYQSTPEDRRRAYTIGVIYVVLAIALATMLFKIWPPIPWPGESDKDRARLIAIIKETGCEPSPTPTPSPTATPTPPTASPTATPTATQPPAGGSPTPTPVTGQTGISPTTGGPGGTQQANDQTTATDGAKQSGAGSPPGVTSSGEVVSIPMKLFGPCVQTTFDERLLLLVIIAGMLGAFVHGATSLADYLGNNSFNKNWTWFYLLRPAIGMALALVFYFAIRGGFLSTTGGAKDINPYGIAALAGMVGMFSKQATDKLGEVFGTLFKTAPGGGDDSRSDPLKPKTVAVLQLDPVSVIAGSEAFTLAVTGTGFINGAIIHLDDVPQTTAFQSETRLTAQVAKETVASAGTRKLTVVNPDTTTTGPVDFVVSANGTDVASAETAVTGEGGDEDLIDGCDVDMKTDTPDEDLPITEGGMN
jgi:hypothetical protein